jgi:CRP/FNR family transcriptional regulator
MKRENFKSILFETISEVEIKRNFEKAKIVSFTKGEFLFQEGSEPEYLDLLLDGQLQLFKYDNHSNEATLAFFSPISLVAELASLCNFPYPASARFSSDGKVARMPINLLKELIHHDISMNHFLIQCLLEKVQTLNLTISRGLMMDTMERVAHFLYHMPDDFPVLKHNQIASMLLIRAETFSRALKELKDAGIIESSKGQIQLLKREALKKYLAST